jgi:hypothetical protein
VLGLLGEPGAGADGQRGETVGARIHGRDS